MLKNKGTSKRETSRAKTHQVVDVIDGERGAELLGRVQPRREDDPIVPVDLAQVKVPLVEREAKADLLKLKSASNVNHTLYLVHGTPINYRSHN